MVTWYEAIFDWRQERVARVLHKLYIWRVQEYYVDRYELGGNIRAVYYKVKALWIFKGPIWIILQKALADEGRGRQDRWRIDNGV